MDEKVQAASVNEDDKIQVAVAETAEDIENGSAKDDEPLQSEFLEVRAAAEVGDDATMPCETFRAYTIAVVLTVIGATISNITQFRDQPLAVEPVIIQLIALPIGRFWAKYMPKVTVPIGRWSFKLNPGTFTIKEHTLIVIMANVAVGYPPYALGLIIVQAQNYHQRFGMLYNFLLLNGTEMIGFGLAGICRRWLVYPSDMIWPRVLQSSTFLNTMHRDKNVAVGRWTISRYKIFFISIIACFGYSFLPQFIPFLDKMDIITMIWPKSKIVNLLFGVNQGLALLPLTLSWQTVVTWLGNPQVVPAGAHANILAGMIFWFWIVAGVLYARNHWNSQYFSIGSPGIFDNTLKGYNVTRIMTKDTTFDEEAYKSYSPLLQGPRIALTYALSFASISCVLVHAALNDGVDMIKRLRFGRDKSQDDVHMREMRKYPEVPEWWYQVLLVILLVMSLANVVAWPTFLPWWGFILTMLIPVIFTLPIGIIEARTSQQIGLNVITEFVAGYLWPGKPIANTLVKIYGYMTMVRGLAFVADLKLGVYMKIPPRAMFRFQILGTVIANLTALVITQAMLSAVPDLCLPSNTQGFTCPGFQVFYRATVIWGVIAPARIFSPGAPYGDSMWYFLIGALAPIPFFLLKKRWPKSLVKYVNMPLFFSGTGMIPPATPQNYVVWGATGLFLNGWVMSRYPDWWSKYNYILGNGLGIGVIFTELIFAFLGISGLDVSNLFEDPMAKWRSITLDNQKAGAVFRTLDKGQILGPKTWN